MKRFFRFLLCIVPSFAALGIQLVLGGILTAIYGIWVSIRVGVDMRAKGVTDFNEISNAVQNVFTGDIVYLISAFTILVSGIVFFFWYRYEIRGEMRGKLSTLFSLKNILLLILLGVSSQFFISGMMSLVQPFFEVVFDNYSKILEQITGGNEYVVFVLVVFIAPISEELIFRGMVLHKASKELPFIGANLLQALIFGIYHFNIVQGIYAFIIGLLLGYIYRKFQTIYASIFMHMVINGSAYLVNFVPDQTLSIIIVSVVSSALIGLTIWRLKLKEVVIV